MIGLLLRLYLITSKILSHSIDCLPKSISIDVGKKLHLLSMFLVIDGVNESVECNAMKEWKLSFFNIVDKRIKFYSQNTNLLPPKPKSSFRHLKHGIQEFHRKYVLVPADKAANNVVVVCRLH